MRIAPLNFVQLNAPRIIIKKFAYIMTEYKIWRITIKKKIHAEKYVRHRGNTNNLGSSKVLPYPIMDLLRQNKKEKLEKRQQ